MTASPPLYCATGPFYTIPLADAFAAIAKAGFDGVEVMVTGEAASRDPKTLRAMAEDQGLQIGAIHAPFLLLTRRVYTTDPLEKIKRSVDLAQQVGAPLVVVHPAYRWQVQYRSWLSRELEAFSAREQVILAMENMFPVWVRGLGLTFHKTVGLEDMKRFRTVTLDTSHAAVSGIDITRAYEELVERIVHVHLSNNLGTGRDTHSPLREGVLPIGSFLERLGTDGYSGTITLEIDVRAWVGAPARLAGSLKENHEYCLERLGAAAGA